MFARPHPASVKVNRERSATSFGSVLVQTLFAVNAAATMSVADSSSSWSLKSKFQ